MTRNGPSRKTGPKPQIVPEHGPSNVPGLLNVPRPGPKLKQGGGGRTNQGAACNTVIELIAELIAHRHALQDP